MQAEDIFDFKEMSSEKIEVWVQRLALYKPANPRASPVPQGDSSGNGGARAAVLVCLFQGETGRDLSVILTQRSSKLAAHPGEVALPGGKKEENDRDDVGTALREAREEIGLDSSLVSVVAVLEPFYSQYNSEVIVPVVGVLKDKRAFHPVPCAAEVDAIFHAPLDMFLKVENWRAEEKVWKGDKYLFNCFDYQEARGNKFLIHGLTSGILIKVASIVYGRPPEFLKQSLKFWNPIEYVAKL